MAKRGGSRGKSSRRQGSANRKWLRLGLAVLLGILAAGVVWLWHCFEPADRKAEVKHLCGNYLRRQNQATFLELTVDLWQLYRGDGVPCEYAPGDAPVYGGLPEATTGALRVLRNQAYWVGYDERRRNPAWVAYRLFDSRENLAGPRPVGFVTDLRTIAQVSSEHYTGSGFDRGHLAPNFGIGRCYGPEAQQETFLMSNIVPQRHALNAGDWKKLELREAINYAGRFQEIWIITGPIFNPELIRELPSGIPIPESFYKIVVDEQCGRLRAIAFRFQHDAPTLSSLNQALCTIDELEALTGLDFFPELPSAVQEELESRRPISAW
ncbi:MAG: DNA/RNA non-specific endonuclease [Lentisphaerae bacterium]|jgi:endonuclease G|nr:DNA/RNA non-specific endonuclease [Lentisphaerota bacterium]